MFFLVVGESVRSSESVWVGLLQIYYKNWHADEVKIQSRRFAVLVTCSIPFHFPCGLCVCGSSYLSLARGCNVSHSTVHIFLAEGCAKKNGLFDETDMGSLHMGMHAFACRKWELRGRFDWAPSRTCRRVALPYISGFLAINIEHAPLVLPLTLFMKRLKFPLLPLKTIQTVSNLHCV